jgi:putative alpha-1,2-mannosidase
VPCDPADLIAGYALDRFEGLNNEPDMETPWAYHYCGRPDRTAEIVHAALTGQFGVGRGGLPGNDDSGGLSSWYVWASLGLFPVAGQSLVLLNAPLFARSRIRTGDHDLVIDTEGHRQPAAGGAPQYVQAVSLDGEPLDRSWLTGSELRHAERLVVSLGPSPSGWATTTRPPSGSSASTDPTRIERTIS